MVLVHLSPTTLEDYRRPNLGVLSSPRRVYRNVAGWKWGADNDAFGKAWDADRYRAMLAELEGVPGCLFVTAPDVVGDAEATLELYWDWREELVEFPVALVGQDGMRPTDVPWDQIDAFFIGGSSEWKMGQQARELAAEARVLRKHLHMGRVNGNQRIRYARAIGCDSVDGTCVTRFRDSRDRLSKFLHWAEAPAQGLLEASP